MKGVWYDSASSRYRLVKNRFSTLAENGVIVENRAVMGMTIKEGWETLQKKLHNADDSTVLLEFGGNDCDYNWVEIAASPDAEHQPHTERNVFVAQYAQLIEYAREQRASVMILNLVPLDARRYMDWISRDNDRSAILHWLGDFSMLYRWQEWYNRAVEELAIRYRCPLIDVRSAFLASHQYSHLLCEDGIHPTEAGHAMIDGLITDALRNYANGYGQAV